MTEDAAVTIAGIRSLVAERQRFDEWLSALEARRGETPARVFQRVHGDYLARRDAVVENLHQHVGTLEALEQDLASRLQQLETQLAEREDERAEALLRTAVGEFDSERWESTRHEVEASIAQLGQQRESLTTEAQDTRALLASARHVPPKAADASLPVKSAADVTPAPVAPTADVPIASASPNPSNGDSEIESAFAVMEPEGHEAGQPNAREYSVASESPSTSHAATIGSRIDAEVDAAVGALDGSPGATIPDSLDDIDVFGESNVPPRVAPETARNGEPRPAWGSEAPSNGAATRDAFDDLAFLRSVTEGGNGAATSNNSAGTRSGAPADQAKTLRCTECGTMNFPTEWYCERCGGELAAF